MSTTTTESLPTVETPAAEASEADRAALLRKAYAEATTALRENHRDEFENLRIEKAAALGVTVERKPSKEEKARDALQALLAENPSLKESLVEEIKAQVAKS